MWYSEKRPYARLKCDKRLVLKRDKGRAGVGRTIPESDVRSVLLYCILIACSFTVYRLQPQDARFAITSKSSFTSSRCCLRRDMRTRTTALCEGSLRYGELRRLQSLRLEHRHMFAQTGGLPGLFSIRAAPIAKCWTLIHGRGDTRKSADLALGRRNRRALAGEFWVLERDYPSLAALSTSRGF